MFLYSYWLKNQFASGFWLVKAISEKAQANKLRLQNTLVSKWIITIVRRYYQVIQESEVQQLPSFFELSGQGNVRVTGRCSQTVMMGNDHAEDALHFKATAKTCFASTTVPACPPLEIQR